MTESLNKVGLLTRSHSHACRHTSRHTLMYAQMMKFRPRQQQTVGVRLTSRNKPLDSTMMTRYSILSVVAVGLSVAVLRGVQGLKYVGRGSESPPHRSLLGIHHKQTGGLEAKRYLNGRGPRGRAGTPTSSHSLAVFYCNKISHTTGKSISRCLEWGPWAPAEPRKTPQICVAV